MSDKELKALVASLAEAQKETERVSMETKRFLAELVKESAEIKRDLRERSIETDRNLSRLEGLHGIQFGQLVEAIVEPSCLKLFQQRGIRINQSMRRVTALVDGEELEIDVLLANGSEVVAVEVKSAFRVRDVKKFLEDLKGFRKVFPQYSNHTLYGAVAALEYLEESKRFAARKGLFVLKSAGGLMDIANPLNFRPKKF